MNRKHKAALKLNIMTLFFVSVSAISVTLAWFAYTGISRVSTEIDIQSWLIEFEKDDKTVSNNIVISFDDIYPGMETLHETIKIKNQGDSDAKLSYTIASARILDQEIDIKNQDQDIIKDKLSHDYPFGININLSKNFVLSKGEESEFELSISWPLYTGNDQKDSDWGNLAYQFEKNEQQKLKDDPTYQVRQSLKINIIAKAEQIINTEDTDDIKYPIGTMILYDPENNTKCNQLSDSDTCIRTHVIGMNEIIEIQTAEGIEETDKTVTLLADLYGDYPAGSYEIYDTLFEETVKNWKVSTRKLKIDDVLKIISKDIDNSYIIREGLSDTIIGYINSEDRINNIIENTTLDKYNGYYSFLNQEFNFLVSNQCYWINKEYKDDKAFALAKIDSERSKIYGEEKTNENCSVLPVIIAPIDNLNVE